MEGSKERIDFITEYISAYEKKIKIANKNSLFDEAQLFELFAQEICNLWYGKKFTNLNSIKKNYPCVDLLSEDGEIYVQVSTQEDIPGKIKKTLLSLEEEKYPELSNISVPVFFVLSNDTEQKVKDLLGKNQIGRFPFSVKDNFVSTSMIVQRACNDIEFQKSLYGFLKYEIEGISSTSTKLLNIFDISKNVGLSTINTMINGEYEIDRNSLIKSIQDDDAQFKIVCGDAGSGKSAICKKILMEEERVIFARAEKIASCDSINNIWDLDVVEALKYLGEKKAVIYLDALEYISSASESTKDLGIIFLISSAAILALKELSDSADNRERYGMIRKIGVDEKMINMALFKQIGIFFAFPLLLAIIHSVFGIKFINLILQTMGMSSMLASVGITFVFLVVIYGGYFIITYLCSKSIIRP